jgi:dephospho-CoA kinase
MWSSTNTIVGLTGGMGCGKSTAAAFFAELGFRRLDADQVIREHLLPDQAIVQAISKQFGSTILDEAGQVRRARLAEVVFNDAAALAWLEELLHPLLLAHWRKIFEQSHDEAFIVEVPLLFEKGLENWFDFIICVTTDSVSQLRRLEQKGIPLELARQRLDKQLPLARKCELADFVLLNDGTTEFLREQVEALADRLLKIPTDRPAGRPHASPS